jgi:UDP-GlcNAc:undecaprenyl-phosphate GlcNAc-1-phosphate transferase
VNMLAIGCASLILTCVAIPLVRCVAVHQGLVDRPDGSLKPQIRAIPYGGGIAVAGGTSAALLLMRVVPPVIPVVGAMIVLLLGIVDDAFGVRPLWRLIIGLLAASTLLVMWPFAFLQSSSMVAAGLCCAILGTASMNAYNMTDGSDGLSGIVGLIAAGGLLIGWVLAGETVLAGIAAGACGSIAGFLIFNLPPARVYLGDSGAYWMGFLLTALCIPALSSLHGVVAVMCIMALLELELLASVLRRLGHHQGLAGGDRGHIYDVLLERMGQSKTRLNALYGIVGLLSSSTGVLVWRGAPAVLGLAWLAVLSIFAFVLYRGLRSRTTAAY